MAELAVIEGVKLRRAFSCPGSSGQVQGRGLCEQHLQAHGAAAPSGLRADAAPAQPRLLRQPAPPLGKPRQGPAGGAVSGRLCGLGPGARWSLGVPSLTWRGSPDPLRGSLAWAAVDAAAGRSGLWFWGGEQCRGHVRVMRSRAPSIAFKPREGGGHPGDREDRRGTSGPPVPLEVRGGPAEVPTRRGAPQGQWHPRRGSGRCRGGQTERQRTWLTRGPRLPASSRTGC